MKKRLMLYLFAGCVCLIPLKMLLPQDAFAVQAAWLMGVWLCRFIYWYIFGE